MTILAMANWREGKTFSGGEVVEVDRGQLMTSLASLQERSGESTRTIRTTIANLEKAGFLTNKSTKRFRLISIVNYETYQNPAGATDKATDNPATKHRQSTDNPATMIEEGKKVRRQKRKNLSKANGEATEAVISKWNTYFSERLGSSRRSPSAWAEHVAKALGAGYTVGQCQAACYGLYESMRNAEKDFIDRCDPATALRLRSRDGKKCLPQWIEAAEIAWREQQGGSMAYPWLEEDA
jgi:hypothetical protein